MLCRDISSLRNSITTEEEFTRIALHKKKNPAMKQKLSAAVHFLQRFGRDTPAQRKPA